MYYQINVSSADGHLFATAENSLTNKQRFIKCLKILRKKFPVSQGYKITSIYYTVSGSEVTDLGDIQCP